MRKLLNTVIADIKGGENLEVYLVMLISLAVLVLDMFGTVELEKLVEVILAILALVSFGTLSTRTSLRSLNRSLTELDKKMGKFEENLPFRELSMFGLRNAHKDQSYDYVDQKFREAKEELRILETWIPGVTPLPSGLIETVRRGVPVKILLVNPKSEIAKQRLADQQLKRSIVRPIVALEILQVTINKNNLQNCNIELRFYDSLPPFSLYMADEWMLVGFFWHRHSSVEGPHLEIYGKSSILGWYIVDTFDALWSSATPFPLGKPGNEGEFDN